MAQGKIRVGIGGWSFEPSRGVFYPVGFRQKDELNYAASQMTAIEINATYYHSQSPKSFAAWAAAALDGFQYAVKASCYATNRTKLAEAAGSVEKVLTQGRTALGDKLGPKLWQLAATKKFDADDIADFVYARTMRAVEDEAEGYPADMLDAWADKARGLAKDGRDVYLFFISGAKVRNPAAARAVIERL